MPVITYFSSFSLKVLSAMYSQKTERGGGAAFFPLQVKKGKMELCGEEAKKTVGVV